MTDKEWDDKFLEVLLEECAGGDTPPDVREKVLGATVQRFPFARLLSAAALVILTIAGYFAFAYKPAAEHFSATGEFEIAGNGMLERGSILSTDDGKASINIGEYVKVDLEKETKLRLGGTPADEVVELQEGEILCSVTPTTDSTSVTGVKTFTVRTDIGEIRVIGTKFTVKLEEDEMLSRKMVVNVLAGLVLVAGFNGESSLVKAGERREARRGGGNGADGVKNIVTRVFEQSGRWGANGIAEKDSESAAIGIYSHITRKRLEVIEEQVMNSEDIAALVKVAVEKTRVFQKALEENEDYKRLNKTLDELTEKQKNLPRPDFRDRENREARTQYFQEMGNINKEQQSVREEIRTLPDQNEKLGALKTAKSEAWLAVIKAYNTALEANKEYTKLAEELAEGQKWEQEARIDQFQKMRNEGDTTKKADPATQPKVDVAPAQGNTF